MEQIVKEQEMSFRIFQHIALVLLLASSLPAFGFSTRTEGWKEDALLHDGRTVKVNREVSWTFQFLGGDSGSPVFMKSWPDRFWLKFEHPDTHETIKWQGEQYFNPVLLDVVSGTPYLVVSGRPDKDNEKIYGCPELPYIYLKYEKGIWGRWVPVPVEQAPIVLQDANLTPSAPYFPTKTDEYTEMMRRISTGRSSRDFSHDEILRTIWRDAESRGGFQAKIPRSYDEWNNIYKNSYRNERRANDCRPPRTQLPQVVLPVATEGSPEVLDTINHTPERVFVGDDWGRLTFDQKRERECKKLFRPTDPSDFMQDQRFVNDSTGNKLVPYSRNGQFKMGTRVLCDDDYVWFVTHQEEPGKMIITKFTISGDLAFRIGFSKPEPISGFVGYISIPSLRSEAGYLYFDWMDFRDINREWHIKRTLKIKLREPQSNIVATLNKKVAAQTIPLTVRDISEKNKSELEMLGGGDCRKIAPKVSADIYLGRGKILVGLNKYKAAMACLLRAQEGEKDTNVYRESCYQIATMYELGLGVEKNIETAKIWLRKAGY